MSSAYRKREVISMKILLYGFKAYDEFEDNITEKILLAFPETEDIRKIVFDVKFDRSMFERGFHEVGPDIILGMGQHPRASEIHIERFARNAWASREMNQVLPIEGAAEASLLEMSLALPMFSYGKESVDAGTYVCNYSMYCAESYSRKRGAQAGFIHVPITLPVDSGVKFVEMLIASFHSDRIT
jgi:pyrrolidone-carboxylate peptidase